MKTKLRLFVSASIAICLSALLNAKDKERKWGSYDRLIVLQDFLDAIYPDLRNTEGLLILRTEELHVAGGDPDRVEIAPCKPGSGIILADKPGQTIPPHCLGLPVPGSSDFLSISLSFGRKRHPIGDFDVKGSFVESSWARVATEIVQHSDWTDAERVQAVREAGPRFGPDHKDDFIRVIPYRAIFEFTGCNLELNGAEFIAARLEGEAGRAYAIVEWRVTGNRRVDFGKRTSQRCVARFEPFAGRLLSVAAQ